MFEELITILLDQSKQELPGTIAQQKMAPSVRYAGKGFPENISKAKRSAVLLLLYPSNTKINIVLIERSKYAGVHSGQISLPGGKFESEDNSLFETALREAKEEVGIIPNDISIIRELTPLYVPASGYNIQPFLSYIKYTPKFIADITEVNYIIEANICEMFKPPNTKIKKMITSDYNILAPYYRVGKFHIWGATAMILSELHFLLKRTNLLQ